MIHVKKIRKPKSGNTSGSGAGSGFAAPSAGSSDYSEKAGYASQAGHAETAARATRADMAEQLTDEVWQQIDNKDAETLAAAKNYANGNFLSKKNNDTAHGFIQFLAGIGIGPAETWGYVKKVTENGVEKIKSWFKNLATDILTVTGHIKGNSNGILSINDDLDVWGDIHADGDVIADGDVEAGGTVRGKDGSFSGTVTAQNLKVTGLAEFFKLIIDELRAAGGAQLYTAADGFAVEAVTRFEYDGGHRRRLWWRATDGKKSTQSKWVPGMQAVCMNFNAVTAPGQYDNVSNHQFWAVVSWCNTEKNTAPPWDSTNPEYVKAKAAFANPNAEPPNPYEVTDWHYIDLYCGATANAVDNSTSDEKRRLWKGDIYNVAVGDEIAMLGYRPKASDYVGGKLTEDARRLQSAVYVSAYSSYDDGLKAPFLAFYQGIDDFDLSSHRKTYIDAFGSKFYGDFYAESGGEGLAGLLSTLEVGLDGIRGVVSSLPVSRNLLLNSDFAEMAETANGCIHLVPTTFWQGYQQESRNAQGEWVNRLVGGATYTLSFYARGKGRVGAVVHHTLLAGDTSQGNQSSMLEYLTPKPKLFTMTFTPSANCPFRVMIGSNSYGIGEEMPGTEIYISRPKLVRNSESTTNLLTNPNLGNVADGIPQGWTLWDNWESGSAAPVKTREIVPELYPPSTPVKWERWTNGDTGLSPSTNVGNLEDGVYPINIVPRSYWNGLAQRSYVREGADGWGGGAKVLKHDAWYTLSFEAKGTRSGVKAGFIIDCVNLANGSDKFGKAVGGTAFEWDLTTSWRRYTYKFKAQANYDTSATDTDGYGFSLMLGLVNAISGTYTQNVIQIRRPQLEEGETVTEWRRGEENTALMQTQFKQLSDRMELGVYRDGVKRSGMTLDEDGVEFDGDRVKINGDLDLQGLTTENVHIAENIAESIRPTVINMGIGATGNEVVKSVFVKPNNETPQTLVIRDPLNQTNGIDAVSCKVVVLPLWGSDFENWNSAITFNAGTGADAPLRGSFMLTRSRLYNGESMPDVARRVVPWRKSGTRVTVSNAAAESTMNWQSLMTEPIWNDDIETWSRNEPANNTTYYTRTRLSNIISHVRQLLGRAVLVCADPRILAYENIEASFHFTGMEDETTMHKAGCFSCAGWRSRFIILLPGQTLQLRSQITTSSTGSEVLTWVVENTEEFTPLSMTLSLAHGKYADSIDINYLGDAVYYPFDGGHAVLDTIVGHPLLKHVRKTFQAQAGVSQVFYTGGIELDFNIETN